MHIPPVPLSWYLLLSAILFALGAAGFVYRKSVITVFMSIELMLNAVNLSFVSFSYQLQRSVARRPTGAICSAGCAGAVVLIRAGQTIRWERVGASRPSRHK